MRSTPLVAVLLLCACDASSGPAAIYPTPVDGSASDAPEASADVATEASPEADSPATATIVFHWVSFTSNLGCQQPVTCSTSATCPLLSDGCTCITCVNPPGCIQPTITPKCCTQAATINAADLGRVATDYPQCTLAPTSPSTYALDCGWRDDPHVYNPDGTIGRGAGFKYTDDSTCTWSPPYAIP